MRRRRLREPTDEGRPAVERLAHPRPAPARRVERGRIVRHASQGRAVPEIADRLRLGAWLPGARPEDPSLRCRRPGRPRGSAPCRPATASPARAGRHRDRHRADRPQDAGPALRPLDAGPAGRLPGRAPGDRGRARPDRRGPPGRGPAPASARELVRRAGRPRVRGEKGRIEAPHAAPPPAGSPVVRPDARRRRCRGGRGAPRPMLAKRSSRPRATPDGPGRGGIDHGRRGTAGAARGATSSAPSGPPPRAGDAVAGPHPGRGTACWVAFPEEVGH
jgi:hypothetical protein